MHSPVCICASVLCVCVCLGGYWDTLCGSHDAAASSEGEDGAPSLPAASGSWQMGESV